MALAKPAPEAARCSESVEFLVDPSAPQARRGRAMIQASCKTTFEEFLERPEDSPRAEWVNGEIIEATPPSEQHQNTAGFLAVLLRYFAEERDAGEVLYELLMRLPSGPSGREPDILFVATEHLGRIQKNYLDGPADLAIEIVSPESAGRDRGDKFFEYEKGGVPEYWLIDPERGVAEFYQLDRAGRY